MTTIDNEWCEEKTVPPTPEMPELGADSYLRAEYQRIWLRTQSRPWQTLAVVPGDDRISSQGVAALIIALGLHHGESIRLADLRDVQLNRVGQFLNAAVEHMRPGERMVFATRSIRENLSTIPLARGADCAILCASLGSTSLAPIEETIEQIGKDHFLGSILIHAPKVSRSKVGLISSRLRLPARS